MTTEIGRPEQDAQVGEPATRWTQLETELRMICRSLASPQGWTPDAVTTFVGLPGDAEYRQAMSTLCRRLGLEYRLEAAVRRQGDDWSVRFARPVVTGKAVAAQSVPVAAPARSSMRAAITWACAVARHLPGLAVQQRVEAV